MRLDVSRRASNSALSIHMLTNPLPDGTSTGRNGHRRSGTLCKHWLDCRGGTDVGTNSAWPTCISDRSGKRWIRSTRPSGMIPGSPSIEPTPERRTAHWVRRRQLRFLMYHWCRFEMERSMFHYHGGLSFGRLPDGSVLISKTELSGDAEIETFRA